MESFSLVLDSVCGARIRPYLCSLYLPPCGEKAIVPCQELCLKTVNDCPGSLAGTILEGLRESCYSLPKETDDLIECYNVNELPVDEVSNQGPGISNQSSCEEIRVPACMTGIGYSSTYVPSLIGQNQDEVETFMESFSFILDNACSAYFRPYMCALYLPPCGEKAVSPCQELCLKVVNDCSGSLAETILEELRGSCYSLPKESDGFIECYNVNELPVDEVSNQGPGISNQSSCEEIRVPACMTGIGYSSTYIPNFSGQNQDEVEALMESFSLILDNACSAFFRPYMCALYLPPCGEKAIFPCQELCLKAVNDCAGTLAGSFSRDEVIALRKACSSMPSEADNFIECYNVNEVLVGEVSSHALLGVTLKSVSCAYNLLPVFQPRWFSPDGVEITDDVNSRIKVNHVSGSVTELSISQFTDSVDAGTYVCTGANKDSAVPVVISDVTNMYNTTEPIDVGPGISGQRSCSASEFLCDNGECISRARVCDSIFDCADESDETEDLCQKSSSGCSVDEHRCFSGECLRAMDWCNSKSDCADNSDEENCDLLLVLTPSKVSQVSSTRIDVSLECSSLYLFYSVQEQPAWITPDGDTIQAGSSLRNVRVEYVNDFTSRLVIEGYTDEANGGTYVCGVPSYAKSSRLNNLNPKQIGENCEEIRVPACMTGISYSSTYIPNFSGQNQDEVEALMESFSLILDNACSAFFRPYMCSLYLPPCGEKAIFPCQELCLKAVNDCAGTLAGSFSRAQVIALREACSSMPSEADNSIECYNVNELSVDEVSGYTMLGRTDKHVYCTYNLLPAFQPKWFNPDGVEITNDFSSRIRVLHVSDNVTSLSISEFTDSVDAGTYVCTGSHEDSAVPVVIGDVTIMYNSTESDEGPGIPDQSSCEEIRVPACMTGIGYSSTYVPNFSGQSQDEVEPLMESFSLILDNACSAFFRPYMCALYLPPCGEKAIFPCQELCLKAVNDCAGTLAGSFSRAEVIALREACSSMPSEADNSIECYNVNEVSVDEVGIDTNYGLSSKYVYCTYNLLPVFQPKWFSPDGVEITDDVIARVKVYHTSDSSTVLYIGDFTDSVDAGTYVCTGANKDSAVPVVIGDVTMYNTTSLDRWPDITSQSSCERIVVPVCTKGIGYSSANIPSFIDQNDFLSTFAIFSSFFNAACSPYFRPYICSLYFPPCQEPPAVPCREMCMRAASECEETLGEDPGNVIAEMRKSCGDLPSETDPSSQCYYVKEVEIGETTVLGSDTGEERYVECTYNLLPEFQPLWSGPDGVKIAGPPARISSIKVSPTVSRLHIRDFDRDVDGGTYTCNGRDQTSSVDV